MTSEKLDSVITHGDNLVSASCCYNSVTTHGDNLVCASCCPFGLDWVTVGLLMLCFTKFHQLVKRSQVQTGLALDGF